MALFKIFRGPENRLNEVPLHEGYAYFTEDKGNLFIDVSDQPGGRKQINAYAAQVLSDGVTEIDIDDIFLKTMTATVAQGGTGTNSLTLNALLIGNGTNTVKMVSINNGHLLVGDSTDGVKGLHGTGVLYAATDGAPQFGTAPIASGGTGAITAADARSNLDVYNKQEVSDRVAEATTMAYSVLIPVNGWQQSGSVFTYSYANANLKCGKNGNVPPIITYVSNLDEYSKIDSAEATVGVGIVFTIPEKPTADISIIVIDVK